MGDYPGGSLAVVVWNTLGVYCIENRVSIPPSNLCLRNDLGYIFIQMFPFYMRKYLDERHNDRRDWIEFYWMHYIVS